jgi:hypothetical protein
LAAAAAAAGLTGECIARFLPTRLLLVITKATGKFFLP